MRDDRRRIGRGARRASGAAPDRIAHPRGGAMTGRADIVIVVGATEDRLRASTLELLGAAAQMASQCAARVNAILFASAGEALARDLIAHGADRVYLAPIGERAHDVGEARLPAIAEVCRQLGPRLVLFMHGVIGAELAPRLAFRLDGAAATGCVDIAIAEETICCTRPCYGGVAREVERFAVAPLVATVRAGVFSPATRRAGRAGEIVALPANAAAPRTRLM